MLPIGKHIAPFSGIATTGETISDVSLRGKMAVLYFFPRAFTPSCTIETRGFRDNDDEFHELGARVVGISTDTHERQCKFSEAMQATFPMIGDEDRTITRAFKVLWPLIPLARRVTFVADADGIIIGRFAHEFQVSRHLDEVLHFVRRTQSGRSTGYGNPASMAPLYPGVRRA